MRFSIKKNKALNVHAVKMKCDQQFKNLKDPLPQPGFLMAVTGGPGQGKTTLLINFLTEKDFYKKRFDRVEIWSPSMNTAPEIDLPDDQKHDELDVGEVMGKYEDLKKEDKHVLWIFDDMNTEIAKPENLKPFLKMAFNRRHASKSGKGSLSIIIVSQAYNVLPLKVRKGISCLAMYRNNNREEMKSLYKELFSFIDEKTFFHLIKMVFTEPHSFLFVNFNLPLDKQIYKNFDMVTISGQDGDEDDIEFTDS